MKKLTLCTVLALGISSMLAHAATFQRLGDLPGAVYSYATGLSDDGSVVVGNSFFNNVDHAWRWTATEGIQALGYFPGGGSLSFAAKVSADGRVIGGHGLSANGIEAMRWEAGIMAPLGDLPGGPFQSDVRAVSGDGSVLVGYGYNASGNPQAFRWTAATGLVPLQPVPGAPFPSDPAGVSEDGLVVVGGGRSANGLEAFRWENGVIEGLGDLQGGAFQSGAAGVSADGAVVVGVSFSANGVDAFRWTRAAGMQAIVDSSGILTDNIAVGVSGDGSIVVGISSEAVNQRAFIWDASHGMRKLQTVLENELGLASQVSGWTLTHTVGISRNGRFIAGYGTNPSGHIEGWLVDLGSAFPGDTTPPTITCPEDMTVSADASTGTAVVNFNVTASDNSGGVSVVCDPASGSSFPIGTNTVHCTATDAAGNTAICSFTVTVNAAPDSNGVFKQWDKVLGGAGNDLLNDVRLTSDGGFIAAGYSDSPAGSGKAAAYGGYDYWVVKFDASANVQWERTFGGENNDLLYTALPLRYGGYLLVGTSYSGVTGNKTIAGFGGEDIWLIRLDSNGNHLWERSYGGSADDEFGGHTALIETSDGGFLVSGNSRSPAGTGNKTAPLYFTPDVWLLKLDSNGLKQWERTYNNGGHSQGAFLNETSDAFFVAGFSGVAAFTAWSARLDKATGDLLSQHSYGAPIVLQIGLPRVDGGYWMAGYTYVANSSFWLTRVDAFGNFVINRTIGGVGEERAASLAAMREGGYLAGGMSTSPPGGDRTAQSYGGADYWLVKFTDQGGIIWDKSFGGTGADWMTKCLQTPDGGILLGGYSDSAALPAGGKSAGSLGGLDWWIIKLGISGDTTPPTAIAGLDQNIRADETVFLNGSASFDDNTTSSALVYSWSFSSRPTGSAAILTGGNSATPSFVADVAGTYDVQLVVTDASGLSSTPDHVICSSANLAPTSVATVDFSLVIIGQTAHLTGSSSTDPELDPLTYSWSITAKPSGSAATLVNAATATPTLTPDLEGVYQVTLVASDFIGPGTPATVEVTATTAAGFAEFKILTASSLISSLSSGQITTQGNQTAILNFLSQAVVALQQGNVTTAIDKLQKSLERTDGCVLRGSPDGNGAGRDWITDCAAQSQLYSLLNAALDALTP